MGGRVSGGGDRCGHGSAGGCDGARRSGVGDGWDRSAGGDGEIGLSITFSGGLDGLVRSAHVGVGVITSASVILNGH